MKVVKGEFNNGLKYILIESPTKTLSSISINVMVGSKNEEKLGISHFIEHMLFKGTKSNPTTKKLTWEIEQYGAIFNAFTTFDHTRYTIDINNKYIDKGIQLLYDIINNSLIDNKELNKERKVILKEQAMYKDDESDKCFEKICEIMYKGINTNILGTEKTVKGIKRNDIINYMNKYYNPNNMILTIVGEKLNENQLSIFKKLKNKYELDKKICNIIKHNNRIIHIRGILNEAHICIGYPIKESDKYIFNLISYALTGYFSSRLYDVLREKNGLIYNVNSSIIQIDDKCNIVINLSTKNNTKYINRCIKLILIELERFKKLMPKQYLSDIKKGYINNILNIKTDNSSINTYYIDSYIYGNELNIDDLIDKISNIKREIIKEKCEIVFDVNNIYLTYISNK